MCHSSIGQDTTGKCQTRVLVGKVDFDSWVKAGTLLGSPGSLPHPNSPLNPPIIQTASAAPTPLFSCQEMLRCKGTRDGSHLPKGSQDPTPPHHRCPLGPPGSAQSTGRLLALTSLSPICQQIIPGYTDKE